MYLVHEHSHYTSAIDKYWVFEDKDTARTFYKELVSGYGLDSLNNDYTLELYNDIDPDATIIPEDYLLDMLQDPPDNIDIEQDVYLCFTKIVNGHGRRL